MIIADGTNWPRNRRGAWLLLALVFALRPGTAEAGCGDHARVLVGDIFGVQSLDIPPEPAPSVPAPRCSGPQCSRMPAFPASTSAPTGRFLEAWAYAPGRVVTDPARRSAGASPEPSVRPILRQSDHFRPPR